MFFEYLLMFVTGHIVISIVVYVFCVEVMKRTYKNRLKEIKDGTNDPLYNSEQSFHTQKRIYLLLCFIPLYNLYMAYSVVEEHFYMKKFYKEKEERKKNDNNGKQNV